MFKILVLQLQLYMTLLYSYSLVQFVEVNIHVRKSVSSDDNIYELRNISL